MSLPKELTWWAEVHFPSSEICYKHYVVVDYHIKDDNVMLFYKEEDNETKEEKFLVANIKINYLEWLLNKQISQHSYVIGGWEVNIFRHVEYKYIYVLRDTSSDITLWLFNQDRIIILDIIANKLKIKI